MTELEKAIQNLKHNLQNEHANAYKTQEAIIKLFPYIEKAQQSKTISPDLLLNIVLKTNRLLDFSRRTMSVKGEKYSSVLDDRYYGSNLQSHLDAYRLEHEMGIPAHRILIKFPSKYSEAHDSFEKLIDSVPGKRNEFLMLLSLYCFAFGGLIALLGVISVYPFVAGILMVLVGLIGIVSHYVRTGFAKQMYLVSKARQLDEAYLTAPQLNTIFRHAHSNDSSDRRVPFFMNDGALQTFDTPETSVANHSALR